jgi:hypothetical protein
MITIQSIIDKHLKSCYETHGVKIPIEYLPTIHMIAKEACDHHAEQALKAASEQACVVDEGIQNGRMDSADFAVDKNSILNAYPLTKIK